MHRMITHQSNQGSRVTIEDDGPVACIRLNCRETRNVLDVETVRNLEQAFRAVSESTKISVVILAGLPDIFCAGASKELLQMLVEGRIEPKELGLPRLLMECPVPVIAAMQGNAVGGGFALGLGADIVILNERQRYGFNFMDLGLTPGMGVTWLARERLGSAVGDELMYSAEYRRGRDFARLAGVNHVVAADRVEPLAHDFALRIAEKPRSALMLLKKNQSASRIAGFDAAREEEMRMHRIRLADPETRRLIEANYKQD